MVFNVTVVTFPMTQIYYHGWMMDEFIHWPTPYLCLSTVACDEALSWIIEIWMKSRLVSDMKCKTINL
jgi:hypothetical protein